MNTIKSINRIGENDLRYGTTENASWHKDYQNSAYIFIANLNYNMSEGDIVIVFSQYGEPVDVHLVKNKKTGQSRGFCFLAYEDQRSSTVAVDNFNGSDVCGRILRVDHVKQFKPPREYLDIKDDDPEFFDKLYKPSGPDGRGWGEFRAITNEEQRLHEKQQELLESKEILNEKILDNLEIIQNQKYFLDADERWEKMLMEEMENEQEIMKKKIEELKQQNAQLIKYKEPKQRLIQETNAEKQQRLDQQTKQRSKNIHKSKDHKSKKNHTHHKSH